MASAYDFSPQDFEDAASSSGSRQNDSIAAEKIKKLWDEGRNEQKRQMLQYQVNTSFYMGNQWLEIPSGSETVVEMPRDEERVRITANRILTGSRINLSKLAQRLMGYDVQPPGADDKSLISAKLAESIIRDVARTHDWERIRTNANLITWLSGTAVLSLDWDPRSGNQLGINELTGEPFGTGDIVETVSSISEAVFEPGTTDPERARWWIRGVALSAEKVQEMYGLESKPSTDISNSNTSTDVDPIRATSERAPKLTLVLTYYERPSEKSDGKVCVMVGNKIVQEGPWPFPFTEKLNCVVMRESKVPSRWYGETVVSSAVPLQVAYNAQISSLVEHAKLAGNARLAVARSEAELVEDLTDTPGEIVFYNTMKPEWITPAPMVNWATELLGVLRKEIDDVLGNQEVSRGGAIPNAESGAVYQVAAEQADTPLTSLAREQANAWSKFATMALEILKENVTETRTARVEKEGMASHEVEWTGSSIGEATVVTIPLESVLPWSRVGRQQWAMQLYRDGIITDIKALANLAEFPDAASITQEIDPDVDRAERENYYMSLGQEREVEEFDNHATHIQIHNKFRKTTTYEQLPSNLKMLVDEHCRIHTQLSLREAADQMSAPTMAGIPQHNEPIGSATNPGPMSMASGLEMASQPMPEENMDMPMQEMGNVEEPYQGEFE